MADAARPAAEDEVYPVSKAFQASAHVKSLAEYQEMYRQSLEDPEAFWGGLASDLHWERRWSTVGPEFNFDPRKAPVSVRWFAGGRTNLAYNCLDRHVEQGHGSRPCVRFEGNDLQDSHRTYTYADMLNLVCCIGNALRARGVKKGDRVAVYLPMIVELPATMLACARIGAVHTVVFGGFSAEALAGRIQDAEARLLITADGVMRGSKPVQLKSIADEAVALCAKALFKVQDVVVARRLGGTHHAHLLRHEWHPERDTSMADFLAGHLRPCEPEWMDSEDPLFMLYTSGSTGKPKGVLHTTGGFMVGTYAAMKYTFDIRPEDTWFCTADCGWITGHTFITYGPLLCGTTQVVFEGVPTYPDAGRFWQICEKYRVTCFYTAPTAIRSLMASGDGPVKRHDLSSLRLLGTVGEPINPEAWRWFHSAVGKGRCPIVDTYWQTETGGPLLAPMPGATALKPGSACVPFFGVEAVILDIAGKEMQGECSGALAVKSAPPAMLRTLYQNQKRFEEAYFSQYPGYFFTGDGCRRDKDGFYWLTGRLDDVMNVSGHRIGTAEVESALVAHSKVAEAAVVGFPHATKGEGIWCFVTLNDGERYDDALKPDLAKKVREMIGPFAVPDEIHWAPGLPKTRSGKIMRRVLRKLALPSYLTEDLGDTSTLSDPAVVEALKESHPRKQAHARL